MSLAPKGDTKVASGSRLDGITTLPILKPVFAASASVGRSFISRFSFGYCGSRAVRAPLGCPIDNRCCTRKISEKEMKRYSIKPSEHTRDSLLREHATHLHVARGQPQYAAQVEIVDCIFLRSSIVIRVTKSTHPG